MFRDIPKCSGMFHVPGFIDGRFDHQHDKGMQSCIKNVTLHSAHEHL